jgi:hypothetical protein
MKERAATALSTLETSLGGVRDFEETQPLVHLALAMIVRGLGRRRRAPRCDASNRTTSTGTTCASPPSANSPRRSGETTPSVARNAWSSFSAWCSCASIAWRSNGCRTPRRIRGGKKADRLGEVVGRPFARACRRVAFLDAKAPEVNVDGGVPKVLQRLGLRDGKGGATALRDHVKGLVSEADLMAFVTILHGLAETTCVSPKPDCDHCPAKGGVRPRL